MNDLSQDARRNVKNSRLRLFEKKRPLGKFRNRSACQEPKGSGRGKKKQVKAGLQSLQNDGKPRDCHRIVRDHCNGQAWWLASVVPAFRRLR